MEDLKQIREALIVAEKLRFDSTNLSKEQLSELERASLELRRREREIISIMQDNVVKAVKESSKDIENVIKLMRNRAIKMSKSAKSAEKVKKAIDTISGIASQLKKL